MAEKHIDHSDARRIMHERLLAAKSIEDIAETLTEVWDRLESQAEGLADAERERLYLFGLAVWRMQEGIRVGNPISIAISLMEVGARLGALETWPTVAPSEAQRAELDSWRADRKQLRDAILAVKAEHPEWSNARIARHFRTNQTLLRRFPKSPGKDTVRRALGDSRD